MTKYGLSAACAMVLAVGALSGVAFAGDETAADPRLGEQVDSICFRRNIKSFTTIKGEDNAVLLRTGVKKWYKVTLIGACSYKQLKWAQSVAIDQRPGGGCISRGDNLVFGNSISGGFDFPNSTRCTVSKIYKWDRDAAKSDAAEDEDGD